MSKYADFRSYNQNSLYFANVSRRNECYLESDEFNFINRIRTKYLHQNTWNCIDNDSTDGYMTRYWAYKRKRQLNRSQHRRLYDKILRLFGEKQKQIIPFSFTPMVPTFVFDCSSDICFLSYGIWEWLWGTIDFFKPLISINKTFIGILLANGCDNE